MGQCQIFCDLLNLNAIYTCKKYLSKENLRGFLKKTYILEVVYNIICLKRKTEVQNSVNFYYDDFQVKNFTVSLNNNGAYIVKQNGANFFSRIFCPHLTSPGPSVLAACWISSLPSSRTPETNYSKIFHNILLKGSYFFI